MRDRAVIFDVDGTVAIRDKGPTGRSPYDMTRVSEDTPNLPVLEMAKLVANNGPGADVALIFVSGRDESARKDTEQWLIHHLGQSNFYLYMRAIDDMRPDETMKAELLAEISNRWDVIGAFDDRNKVVDMWRGVGITCFQVCSREEGGF